MAQCRCDGPVHEYDPEWCIGSRGAGASGAQYRTFRVPKDAIVLVLPAAQGREPRC